MGKERRGWSLWDAPVTDHANLLNRLRILGECCAGADRQDEDHKDPPKARGPRVAGDGSVLDLHRLGPAASTSAGAVHV